VLDGEVARATLSIGLGFSRADRDTHILRVAHVAHLLSRNGIFVAVAAISPYRRARAEARAKIGAFVEIHVMTPLDECIKRDVKGLYARAIKGEIACFTGISDPYEAPVAPEIEIDTRLSSADESADEIIWRLQRMGHLPPLR
jgi:adenylylsulfate kinase